MTRFALLGIAAAATATLSFVPPALACGGFACDGGGVIQTGERLLFALDEDDDQTTMVVEVQYSGATNFGWVLPVPLDVGLGDIGTVPASFFDDLETATAPRFYQLGGDTASGSSISCFGPSQSGGSSSAATSDDEETIEASEVKLLGEVTLGAFEVDLLAALDADSLQNWLVDRGYVIPSGFAEAAQPYVAADMHFIALQLAPDAPAGVVDAVTITMNGTTPSIPLVLTSISASTNMEITTYVVSDERSGPAGWAELQFDWSTVELTHNEWLDTTVSDYPERLEETVEAAGGRAFLTEFAGPTEGLVSPSAAPAVWLSGGSYLTRMRTFVDPTDMTSDPIFVPAPELGDQDNVHRLWPEMSALTAGAPLVLLLLLASRRRREG